MSGLWSVWFFCPIHSDWELCYEHLTWEEAIERGAYVEQISGCLTMCLVEVEG